jgi:DNA-binding NarL/FixJ family response regulator
MAAQTARVPLEVFVVDDSAPVRERLLVMLGELDGIRVVGETGDAAQAIRAILDRRPQVVLLDLQLGDGSSGFDVLRAVCLQAPEVDFYMLSNFAADPYRELAERLGARGFFDKSKEFERMREIIAQRAAAVNA